MTLYSLIVDDEKLSRQQLKTLLEEHCSKLEIIGEVASVTQARDFIDQYEVDLIFLDIEMPEENGFALLEVIDNSDTKVVFVTSHDHYAVKAIKANAFDYLLKPVTAKDLIETEKRLLTKHEEQTLTKQEHQLLLENLFQQVKTREKPGTIALHHQKGFRIVKRQDVVSIEANGSYTNFYLTDHSKVVTSGCLKDFNDLFEEPNFVRVHRSHVINLNHLKEYVFDDVYYAVMNTGQRVEISRRKKEHFLEKVAQTSWHF